MCHDVGMRAAVMCRKLLPLPRFTAPQNTPLGVLPPQDLGGQRKPLLLPPLSFSLPSHFKLPTIERKLTLIRCPYTEKTNLAAKQLQAAAEDWSENFLSMQPAGCVINWAQSHDASHAFHVPKGITDLKQHEFLSLTQGNKSIKEYLCEFNHLARYAPDDVNTDTRKQNWFMNELSDEMQLELAAHSFLDFQDLVNRSVAVESKMKNLENKRKRRRPVQFSAAGGSQRTCG
uniref:Retrotransposon gag domain-containing protein n=1 Tax=Oryza brachyantha TaxID=4533 RepID=J3NDF1_ORYBR